MVEGPRATPPCILVVDDDRAYLDFMATLLGFEAYAARLAASLAEADEALREEPPDLVICDLRLPGAPVAAVLDRLVADPAWAAPPVLLCSGAAQDLDDGLRRLGRARAQALLKPFDIDELLACVRRALHPPRA